MEDKLVSLADAAALVTDGQTVAFGGSLLHRSPAALHPRAGAPGPARPDVR